MSNTLTITFPTTSPAPVNGYQISYWPTSTPGDIQTVTVFNSPAVISGLTEYKYEGTVQALCRGEFTSNTLTIPPSNPVCQLIATVENVVPPDNTEGTNGQADVTVTGGSDNYSIVWSNTGNTDFNITDLSIGDNPFVVTDNDTDCSTTGNVYISNTTFVCPLGITIEQSSPTNSTGTNGQATVLIDAPAGDITYLWTNGQTTATATGLQTGIIYTCTVTWVGVNQEDYCTKYISTTPIAPTTFVCDLSASFTTTRSYLTIANGTATITVSGGTGPYKYVWSNGQTTTTSSDTNTATGLAAGLTYTCFVTDLSPAVTTCSNTFTISIYPIDCNLVVTDPGYATAPDNVAGDNGTAAVGGISNAVAPLSYSWNTVPVQTTKVAVGLLENTTYTCTVTDGRGCTINVDFEIPSGTCTETVCSYSCCTYLLENTAQDSTFTYYDCFGNVHDREIGINSLSATICANKDYGDIIPYEHYRWWTLTLLGCCISECMTFTLYPDTFPYSSTIFRYKPCYSDIINIVSLNAGDLPITICVNMTYGIRKVAGNGYYVMGDSCILDQGGVIIEHVSNSNSLIINQITGIYGFIVTSPIIIGNVYTGSHPFGLTSGSITINVSNISHGDTVTIYKNNPGDTLISEYSLVNGDNIITGLTYDDADNLFFIFENNS